MYELCIWQYIETYISFKGWRELGLGNGLTPPYDVLDVYFGVATMPTI